MTYCSVRSTIQLTAFVVLILAGAACPEAAERCAEPVGRLVSLQGKVQLARYGQGGWLPLQPEVEFCPGDRLQTGADSRAALFLQNESILRIDQNSTITFGLPATNKSLLLELLEGVLHIFSHRPRSLQVATPYVNAAVEGTEFLVQSDSGRAYIAVFEGSVSASNSKGTVVLTGGQAATAERGAGPEKVAVVKPLEAVQWTLYYPRILPDPSDPAAPEVAALVRRAEDKLVVGRVEQARELLAQAAPASQEHSDVLALRSIIEVVQNKKEAALQLAVRAHELKPRSAPAGLALSYARQAAFDIAGALAAVEQAAAFNPTDGAIKARLAELLLATGKSSQALKAAREAAAASPQSGRALSVLGFAHLARLETDQAREFFRLAVAQNTALPLARLGLGLAEIRSGDLEKGRAEIEIAAALDPGNSLIRSYLGKAYFEEKRNELSRRQYAIAKQLDPADPTPWFYDAIRRQTVNRPVEALHDLHRSMMLNDNRAVYRSRFLLDDDLAVRGAGLGRIYSELGFEQLALVQGWQSLNHNPANYSAHRFLADVYSSLPRHEISRVSELLKSQLLQPLTVTPVEPHLAESRSFILEGSGPAAPSYNEFNPLFLRERAALQASAVAGDNDLFGDELVFSGIKDMLSYSLGQFYYRTDGFRPNNDQQHRIYNAFIQGLVSPQLSLMAELRSRDIDFGDRTLSFDPDVYSSTIRQTDETASARLGLRYDLQPHSSVLATAIISAFDGDATGIEETFVSVDIASRSDNYMAEVQHIHQGDWFNLQSGAGLMTADETDSFHVVFPIELQTEEDNRTRQVTLYEYARLDLPADISALLGLSGEWLDNPVKDREELNPKVGLFWQPRESTLLRAAAFKTLNKRLIYAQTIEPTLIAGFNQFFDDWEASTAWTYGAAIDHSFFPNWYGGIQYYHRDLNVPFTALTPEGLTEVIEDDWQEKIGSAYLYRTIGTSASCGLEYSYERYDHEQWEGIQGIKTLTTHRLAPFVNFFHPSGLTARVKLNHIDQQGDFGSNLFGFSPDEDRFWVVDLSLGYRLPRRYGLISLEVKNLFDKQFHFLDTDPAHPRLYPEQQILGRLSFAF